MFNRRYAYIYDKIGRIQEARNSQSGRSETFAFDPAHNILSDKASEGKGGNISSGNRLKEYNGIEYTYDALGNLIYRQLPNGENQYYQYDLENQLVRAEIKKPAGNTEIWTYAYDPFGRRLSKERQDKLAWTSTDPKRTHFVWDGSRLLQEYTYKGSYTYIYTDQDSYEPLAQVFDNAKDSKQYLAYFHNDQVGIPREMTDIHGNLLWYGEYTAWGRLKKDERVYQNAHQPFRLQNQYYDEETGLHYNLMRYYEPEAGRFVNQDPIGLLGGDNLYWFAPSANTWIDPLGLSWIDIPKNHGVTQKPHIINAHGHHIIFKGAFEHSPSMKAALARSRSIATKYNIPLNYNMKNIQGRSNLMIASNMKGVHTIQNAEKVANMLEKADKRVTRWMKSGLMNKAQADRYMSKQLTRIGGKVFGKYGSRSKCA